MTKIKKIADYVIELGSGGMNGGELLCAGTPEGMLRSERSATREYVEESLEEFLAEERQADRDCGSDQAAQFSSR